MCDKAYTLGLSRKMDTSTPELFHGGGIVSEMLIKTMLKLSTEKVSPGTRLK